MINESEEQKLFIITWEYFKDWEATKSGGHRMTARRQFMIRVYDLDRPIVFLNWVKENYPDDLLELAKIITEEGVDDEDD